jgi:hypothetical protein
VSHFQLLSQDTWTVLAERSKRRGELRAAIAYVTAPHLRFAEGDLLICDASDKAIKGGMTAAKILESFVRAKAEIYSIEGMHAKLATFNRYTFIGSANMSSRAGSRTDEASLLTDNVQVRSLALAYIDDLLQDKTLAKVDMDFIERIKKIPVAKRPVLPEKPPVRRPAMKSAREARVWWLATRPLSPRVANEVIEAMPKVAQSAAKVLTKSEDRKLTALAKKWVRDPESIETVVYPKNTKFLKNLQRGDVLIFCHSSRSGRAGVSQPATFLLTQVVEGRSHLIFLPSKDSSTKAWSAVEKQFARLGSSVKRNSTRQLKGAELEVLNYITPTLIS